MDSASSARNSIGDDSPLLLYGRGIPKLGAVGVARRGDPPLPNDRPTPFVDDRTSCLRAPVMIIARPVRDVAVGYAVPTGEAESPAHASATVPALHPA